MNYIRECPQCGGPVFGSWLNTIHECKIEPATTERLVMHFQDINDTITPGEATRLCALIRDQISMHGKYCAYCQMQIASLSCPDMPAMQEALEKWEQYTLIEVDRHAK